MEYASNIVTGKEIWPHFNHKIQECYLLYHIILGYIYMHSPHVHIIKGRKFLKLYLLGLNIISIQKKGQNKSWQLKMYIDFDSTHVSTPQPQYATHSRPIGMQLCMLAYMNYLHHGP